MFIQCFCEIANKKRRKRSYYWHRSHLNFIYVCFYFNLSFQFFLFIVSVYCQFICLIYFHTLTSPPSLLSLLYWIIREVSNYLIICSFFFVEELVSRRGALLIPRYHCKKILKRCSSLLRPKCLCIRLVMVLQLVLRHLSLTVWCREWI